MVSVIIPCHNNNNTINRAVSSVLTQTYTDLEVIIVDNGSDDKLALNPLLKSDKRVTIYSTDKCLGAAGARNLGVRKAAGEYVAYLDADDFWESDKLKKQIRVMENYGYNGESPRICFTARRIVYKKKRGLKKGPVVHADRIVSYRKLLKSNQINCSSVLLRRKDALRFPFPDGDIHEDYVVWLKLLRDGGYAAGIDLPLLYYYMSKGSKSGDKLHSAIMTYKVYRIMGIGLTECMIHMATYMIKGLKKYRLRTLLRQISF